MCVCACVCVRVCVCVRERERERERERGGEGGRESIDLDYQELMSCRRIYQMPKPQSQVWNRAARRRGSAKNTCNC